MDRFSSASINSGSATNADESTFRQDSMLHNLRLREILGITTGEPFLFSAILSLCNVMCITIRAQYTQIGDLLSTRDPCGVAPKLRAELELRSRPVKFLNLDRKSGVVG